MPNNPYYVFDANKLKAEGMTKEQIYNAIAEATGTTPSHIDEGFISTLIENNRNRSIHIWKGTRAEFNALTSKSPNTLYVVDDDTTLEDIQAAVESMSGTVSEIADNIGTTAAFYPIRRQSRVQPSMVGIGSCDVIGKVAYIKVNYDIGWFSESASSDTFDLPIRLGHITQGKPLVFAITSHDASTDEIVVARVEIEDMTQGFSRVNVSANSDIDKVEFAFAFPLWAD